MVKKQSLIAFLLIFVGIAGIFSVAHVNANGKKHAFRKFSMRSFNGGSIVKKKFARDLGSGVLKNTLEDDEQNSPRSRHGKSFFPGNKRVATLGAIARVLTSSSHFSPDSPRLKNMAQKSAVEETVKKVTPIEPVVELAQQEAQKTKNLVASVKNKAYGFMEHVLVGFYSKVQSLLDTMKSVYMNI